MGPPAKPIPKEMSDAIGAALGRVTEILEAHLPMIYIKGQIDPPAQVLVVVLGENRANLQVKITEAVRGALPDDFRLNINAFFHEGLAGWTRPSSHENVLFPCALYLRSVCPITTAYHRLWPC